MNPDLEQLAEKIQQRSDTIGQEMMDLHAEIGEMILRRARGRG